VTSLPRASVGETLGVLGEVPVPTVAAGALRRRPEAVAAVTPRRHAAPSRRGTAPSS
jgi:hypothetical protein